MNPVEMFENLLFTSLDTLSKNGELDENTFAQKADEFRHLLQNLYPVSNDEFIAIKNRLRHQISMRMDTGSVIVDNQQPHQPWLANRRAELDFFFWHRYQKYLSQDKHWNDQMIGSLSQVSDDIVDLLGDPQSTEPFQRRGLVLGDVQSGKTSNYTAICNKAADVGYKVIIVLAGMMENLRVQTQERLDKEFAGNLSDHFLDQKQGIKNNPVGVGRYNSYNKQPAITAFTSVSKDFNVNVVRQVRLSLHSLNSPALFVVKKNKSVLNSLIKWLKNSIQQGKYIRLPLLLIDDEADNASVNTKDTDQNPTAINQAIRQLLKLFHQSVYLGITATPYANIFINPGNSDEQHGDDLFPKDFIYTLSAPRHYIGATNIFGEKATHETILESIYADEMEDCGLDYGHKKGDTIQKLPPSLQEALAYFVLSNGIRDVRGDNHEHRSMMVHISRFTDVQNQVGGLVKKWLDDVQRDLRLYANSPEAERTSIGYLKAVWDKYNLASKAGMVWQTFLTQHLHTAAAPIEMRTVNQNGNGLDYANHQETGLRVVAVGGNSLSRGLTLEGLVVSYFYRRSNMYDTLLQMGRWFGYRPNYADLCKLWLSEEAMDWYGYITEATAELYNDIQRMQAAKQTPMEFGLRVRQDPASLIVTARNKMRSAESVKLPVHISGRLLETATLRPNDLANNKKVCEQFINRLSENGTRLTDIKGTHYFWRGIGVDDVETLLRDFQCHPWQLGYQGNAIADFIHDKDDLSAWDVFLAEGSAETPYSLAYGSETLSIKPIKRAIHATAEQISISGSKKRVGSMGAMKIGLSPEEINTAETEFKQQKTEAKSVPDNAYLRVQRPPILVIYVIAVNRDEVDKNRHLKSQIEAGCAVPDHLFAIGVGLPDNGKAEETAVYVLNSTALKGLYADDEAYEDDGEGLK
ncbi:Z1 domain-containing protein [Stenoxybacter acetivorans]|uniref:Z1 domain-containing protein n=1 Tax=Stenoxybacter acetivorans TaxID=422441 RepID=UPI00055DAF2F|nr:Z1 domain-containing protein [Stenoxybacter acetivorans]